MRRVAVGGIVHETNTFDTKRTPLEAFALQSFFEGDSLLSQLCDSPTPVAGMLRGLDGDGYRAVPLLYAAAMPSGLVTKEAYEALLDNLLNRLTAAMPVDGVLLALHGAMVAEGEDDCGGDLLERVRAVVGPDCPLLCALDMHGNVSPRMINMADLLVG